MPDFAGLIVFRNTGNNEQAAGDETPLYDWPADYLRARAQAERAAAKRAQSLAARHAHQELAQHYADLVSRPG
ncbi:MAG: hypothetical protein H0V46_02425 [Sphingomonas sp.]|nr:hypothetical protein [Sphingomonas sp.]